jgi:hypothetical protein
LRINFELRKVGEVYKRREYGTNGNNGTDGKFKRRLNA